MESELKKIKTHLRHEVPKKSGRPRLVKFIFLSPVYWLAAHFYKAPGLHLHRKIFQKGLRLLFNGRLTRSLHHFLFSPMDSVRYFEFNFMWQSLHSRPSVGHYLDISSPRMFSIILLDRFPQLTATIVNPDVKDLQLTKEFIEACGFAERCSFYNCLMENLNLQPESFDTIVSLSVFEHIPSEGDRRSIGKIWELLKPGGRLLISVPCAKEAFEEYIDINEYGLQIPDGDNFIFGQRFYDENLLKERIFSITGMPTHYAVYGERKSGSFMENRKAKISNPDYPFWREPYMIGKEYKYFTSISDMPGLGVIAMEFVKP